MQAELEGPRVGARTRDLELGSDRLALEHPTRMGARFASVTVIAMIALGCGSSPRTNPDASDVDATDVDAPVIGTGRFGDACTSHFECLESYCVEPVGGAGGVCSRVCTDDCPTGFDCLTASFPSGDVKLCIPATGRLCAPCSADDECPGQACLTQDGAGRCATSCAVPADCPTGYTCGPDATAVHTGSFCQPVTGSCTCSAELAGAQRSCSNVNAIGTCLGTQTCAAATGWSACSAPAAIAEACDGVDNDCNFVIDNGVGGGSACTITNAAGSCPGIQVCSGPGGFACAGQMPMAESCNSVDDNCNGTTDEGYPGLGDVCNAGIGACLRYGSVRCNTGGTGVTCGAVAGAPTTEQCNLIDDNCNGSIDETFTTIGMSCAAGVGVCTRYGSFVCAANGLAAECSATPGAPTGTEGCNYLDDDCDGAVDNGFRNVTTGFYDTDANCGACGNDCAAVFASAPNASGACVVAGTPSCGLRCTTGFSNLNAAIQDGCEFGLDATAIYVSGNDPAALDDVSCGLGPTGTGIGNHPCRTISQGLARATSTSRARINVADGTYNEAVTLVNGKNLFGGYRADTWERHLATTSTIIQGVSLDGNHDRTVVAIAITSPTVLEGFVIRGSANVKPGGNSYAIYISGSSANLTIRDNEIFGGRGGPGSSGGSGLNGATGVNAATYTANAYDAFQTTGGGACASTNNRAAYGGGVRTCATDDVGGGNGGGNNCTPLRSTQNSTALSPATAGQPGAGATGGTGGSAGSRGYDALLSGNTCYIPVQGSNLLPMFGADGASGTSGGNASGVTGCTAAAGSVASGHWMGGSAPSGSIASNGAGGGGGGAGGGATCSSCTGNRDYLGGHGGGAGTGGCGGAGGGGGGAGGGAFAIFISGGTAPTIANNGVTLGGGGSGGGGGIGGAGGLGGDGSAGGDNAVSFCTGKGGRGGDGGNGGAGSGGGGGCGGSSYGIFTSGVGSPAYCGSNTVTGGAAGPGGSGGYSAGSSGGSGQAGVVNACTSI